MSGHSKWHSIKHKKGAADARRGKIFTRHAKLITIAARDGGGDPDMNPALRTAIANAKVDNTPNANIEKAIKKGTGEDKEGAALAEVIYEGFGPAGTVMLVHVITDNKNRSVGALKTIFAKNGGNLGEAGTVAWMFEKKGLIMAKMHGVLADEAELLAIDAGAEDLSLHEGVFEIITEPSALMQVREALVGAGFSIEKAEITYLPNAHVRLASSDDAQSVLKLMDALEDDEDVNQIYSNFDIPEEILGGFLEP